MMNIRYRLWRKGRHADFAEIAHLRAFLLSFKQLFPEQWDINEYAIQTYDGKGKILMSLPLEEYASLFINLI